MTLSNVNVPAAGSRGAVLRGKLACLLPKDERKDKKRQDYTFWHQFDEKPSVISGCPGLEMRCMTERQRGWWGTPLTPGTQMAMRHKTDTGATEGQNLGVWGDTVGTAGTEEGTEQMSEKQGGALYSKGESSA